MTLPVIQLKKGKESSVERFHPWIFSGAIHKISGNPQEGDRVTVENHQGKFLGFGHYANGSIAVRVLSFSPVSDFSSFWKAKIEKAFALRKHLGFTDTKSNNVFRLVHGEGDGISGLIIDYYNGWAVMQCHSVGIFNERQLIAEALQSVLGNRLKGIYDKSKETLPRNYSSGIEDGYLFGERAEKTTILENNHPFEISWETGQKTGFFIDQRENRQLLADYSKGKKVLNAFCYSGGFSVYALNAGAELVHSVDSSQKAIELTDRNVALAGTESRHKSYRADVMDFIKDLPTDYDVIILDPPAFAKHHSARHKAIQAYKRLNAKALSAIKPGGILFTFSCSQAVDKNLFNNTIAAASIEAGRKVRILHQLHQPQDHPINIFHPESEYLKGLVLSVD